MERIGLLDDILSSMDNIAVGRQKIVIEGEAEEGRRLLARGLSMALLVFQEAGANAGSDVETVMLVDLAYLTEEQYHCLPTEKELLNSVTVAIGSFEDALRAYKAVQDAAGYKVAEMTYSRQRKYRYRGMPKDAFHNACMAHRARLANNLSTAGINDIERQVYAQRLSNMIAVQDAYVAWQQRALASNNN